MLGRGTLDARKFAAAALWRNLLFAGLLLAQPWPLVGLLVTLGCLRGGGACGAPAKAALIYMAPLIYLVYVLSFGSIAARRLRDAGLPAALSFGLMLLMLADVQWGMYAGLGTMLAGIGGAPHWLMAGLAGVAALCVLSTWTQSNSRGLAVGRSSSTAARILLGTLMAGAVLVWISLPTPLVGGIASLGGVPYGGPLAHIQVPLRIVVAATPLVLSWLGSKEWIAAGRPGVGSPWAYAVTVCIAVIVVGSAAETLLGVWGYLAWLGGTNHPRAATMAPIVIWTGLGELLALLVLPGLLWCMSRSPAAVRPSGMPT